MNNTRVRSRRLARPIAIASLAVTMIVGTALTAHAAVTSGNASISCSSTSYQSVNTYWHRSSGATSFWNDGSSRTVDVRVNNGTKYNYATLASGQWQGWTSANSPIGFWYAKAKVDTTSSGCSSFNLAYSIVHNPW